MTPPDREQEAPEENVAGDGETHTQVTKDSKWWQDRDRDYIEEYSPLRHLQND
jgi:hypothetical protein